MSRRSSHSGDAETAANLVASMWQTIEGSLRPVFGLKGTTALYRRCVHLTASEHGWLSGLHENATQVIDLAALRSTLSRRTFPEVTESGDLLLQTLYELLVSIVGVPMTDKLLIGVLAPLPSVNKAQDATP